MIERMMADNILIEPIVQTEQKHGPIIVPATLKTCGVGKAKVLMVGPGKLGDDGKRIKPMVEGGDIVFVRLWMDAQGKDMTIGYNDGEDHRFVTESDIIAVLEPETDNPEA
jgi:chaperonin GroES